MTVGSGNTHCVPASGSRIAASQQRREIEESAESSGNLLDFARAPRGAWKPEGPDRPHERQDRATHWGPPPRALSPRAWIYCGVRKSVAILEAVIACVRAHLLRGSGRGERKQSHFPMF